MSVTVDVTADDGGPWQFAYTFPIVVLDAGFDMRRFWIYDPEPCGNHDGVANPGEIVLP